MKSIQTAKIPSLACSPLNVVGVDDNFQVLPVSFRTSISGLGTPSQKVSAGDVVLTKEIDACSASLFSRNIGASIWISIQDQGALWRLNPATGNDTAKVPVCSGAIPSLVYDGQSVWAACADEGRVFRLTPEAGRATFTQTKYEVGGRPVQLEFDGTSVWVANEASGAFQRLANGRDTVEETFTYPGAGRNHAEG